MKPTDKVVAPLSCPAGRKDVLFSDDAVRGFWVRLEGNGGKFAPTPHL